jgi:DNA-directed RNA polymerase subunit RPC12/RpoP
MPKRRTYRCSDCGWQTEILVWDDAEPAPDCPTCTGATAVIPGLFAITGNRSRAIDLAQHIAETEGGLTDMKDNLRPGDISVPDGPAMQTAEREAIQRQINDMAASANMTTEENPLVQSEWGGAGGQTPTTTIPIEFATATSGDTKARGMDAVSLAERAPVGSGPAGLRLKVLGADRVT